MILNKYTKGVCTKGYHDLMNRFLSATHTLHQVESLFREEILLAIGRKAHRLPELPLCD